MNRLRKFVVWLHNNYSSEDDEWEHVMACSAEEARDKVIRVGYTAGRVYNAAEWRKRWRKHPGM